MPEESYSQELAFKEALVLLQTGDQEKAKKHFSDLIREDPKNLEFQAGFFCAGWWLNRKTDGRLYRKGRPLAAWYMGEWENFSKQAKDRGYKGCLSFQKAMRFALNQAAENFRLAFQEEGAGSADTQLLQELAVCLIQLEDYSNAADILQYARSKEPHNPRLCFLLGEVLCCLQKKEQIGRGLSYYRDAFLMDFQVLEPRWIASELATRVFTELHKQNSGKLERTLHWFPAYLLASSFNYSLRQLKPAEIEGTHLEVKRLKQEQERVIEKYRERVWASLSFYLLILIYHYTAFESDRYRIQEYEEQLKQLAPELYQVYQKNKLSG